MKYFNFLFAIIFALFMGVQAAPTTVGDDVAARDVMIRGTIDDINFYVKKRDDLEKEEVSKRENQIVTDVLKAIKDTNLGTEIIQYIVDDDTLEPIAVNTIVWAIKNDYINLDTLLKSLNDSGLAVSVIQDLINDCDFYAEIYKLALNYISGLASKIAAKLTGSSKREYVLLDTPVSLKARASGEEILTSLMESLKSSGLANQVVEALVVDDDFYSFGADLIDKLIDEKAISLSELVSALADSGLVPSLFKAFFNWGTLDDVITTALAAAFGKCDGSAVTSSITDGDSATSTTTSDSTSTTSGSSSVCRKKKRSY